MDLKIRSGRKRKFMTPEARVLDGSFPWILESPRITARVGLESLGINPELKPSRNQVRRSALEWPVLSLMV